MKRYLVLGLIALLGLTALFTIDHYYRAQIRQQNRQVLAETTRETRRDLEMELRQHILAVENLRAFMLTSPTIPDRATFERYSAGARTYFPDPCVFRYVDANHSVRYSYPPDNNLAALNLDSMTGPADEAGQTRQITVSNSISLAQGPLLTVIQAPIYAGEQFWGLAQGVFDVTTLLNDVSQTHAPRFSLSLKDTAGVTFWTTGTIAGEALETPVQVGDNAWTLTVGWGESRPEPLFYILKLIWGMGGVFLIGVLYVVNQTYRRMGGLTATVAQKDSDLVETQDRYRALFDTALNMIHIVDRNGLIVDANQVELTTLGYTYEELIGKPLLEIIHPDCREITQQNLKILQTGESIYQYETALMTRSGEKLWVEASITPEMVAGEFVSARAIIRDITERKQAEEALRVSEERLRVIATHTPDHIVMHDRDLRYTFVANPQLGLTVADMLGKTDLDFLKKEDAEKLMRVKRQVLETGQPAPYETSLQNLQGELEFFDGTFIPKFDATGRTSGVIGYFRNVTERKRADEALQQAERHYRTLFEGAPVMYVITRNDGGLPIIADCNELFLSTLGYTREQVVERPLADLYSPDSRRELLGGGYQRALDGKFTAEERQLVAHDGRIVETLLRALPEPDAKGHIAGTRAMFVNITERKRAEESLRESEARYRAVMQSATAAIITADSAGNIVDWNSAAERIFDYTEAEIKGQPVTLLIPARYRDQHVQGMQRVQSGGKSGVTGQTIELEGRRKDGREFPLVLSLAEWEIAAGQFYSGIISDITERRLSEDALRLQIAALEAAANAIVITDRAGLIKWANPAFTTLSGYTAAEAIGRNPRELVKSGQHDRLFYKQLWDTILAGQVWTGEIINRRKDGSLYTEGLTITPVREESGEITHFIAIKQDVTLQKQAQEALRESEASLRESQRVAHVGHWTWDTVKNEVMWSDEMKRIFGLDPARFAGNLDEVIRQTIHPDDQEKVVASNQAVLNEQRPAPLEYRLVWPDQTIRTVWAVPGERITDEQGNILKLTGIVQDITERKELETEKEALSAQYYQAQKMESIGRLAGGIAHDFNNMLVPIIGYAELGLIQLAPDETLYADLSRIGHAARRAANLTQQILAFSRRQVLELKPLNLNEVVTGFQEMLRRLLREDIELRTSLAPDLHLIRADQGQLEQVLMNLVVNARDAMPRGGRLTVETANVALDETYAAKHVGTQPGLYVMLVVSDTGHGMDAETQQRIFEPFFTTKEMGQGTGLGLATVFGIVKQHQGNIWVYSELEQGTSFKVYLPATGPSVLLDETTNVDPRLLRGTEKVLVVEDEANVRQLVVDALQSYGYHVVAAPGPDEGLALAAAHPETIHLLLTDVIMPVMNGQELYQQLAKTRPTLKVLYMSGYTSTVIVDHGGLDRAAAFLQKPFTINDLLQKVRSVLD